MRQCSKEWHRQDGRTESPKPVFLPWRLGCNDARTIPRMRNPGTRSEAPAPTHAWNLLQGSREEVFVARSHRSFSPWHSVTELRGNSQLPASLFGGEKIEPYFQCDFVQVQGALCCLRNWLLACPSRHRWNQAYARWLDHWEHHSWVAFYVSRGPAVPQTEANIARQLVPWGWGRGRRVEYVPRILALWGGLPEETGRCLACLGDLMRPGIRYLEAAENKKWMGSLMTDTTGSERLWDPEKITSNSF